MAPIVVCWGAYYYCYFFFWFFFFGLGFRVLAADGPAAAEQAEAPAEAPAGALWLTEGCVPVGVRGSGIRVSMQR